MGGNPVASAAACAAPERGDLCAATRAVGAADRRPALPVSGCRSEVEECFGPPCRRGRLRIESGAGL